MVCNAPIRDHFPFKDTGLSSLMKLKRSFSSAFAKDNNNSQSEASDNKSDMTTKREYRAYLPK